MYLEAKFTKRHCNSATGLEHMAWFLCKSKYGFIFQISLQSIHFNVG